MELRNRLIALIVIVLTSAWIVTQSSELAAQITATPAPINLSTATPLPGAQLLTETPTRTPTPIGLVVLEAITEANVRSEPDPESERLGTIRAGEIYPVLGRYFRWLQFQYDPSPNGRGWVFDELVTLTGDQSTIRDLAAQDVPTVDPLLLGSTQTLEAITLTPGGLLTATSNAQVIPGPEILSNAPASDNAQLPGSVIALPTFTYPPNVAKPDLGGFAGAEPTSSPITQSSENTQGLPPIVPIAVLGGLGILGLVLSSIRR